MTETTNERNSLELYDLKRQFNALSSLLYVLMDITEEDEGTFYLGNIPSTEDLRRADNIIHKYQLAQNVLEGTHELQRDISTSLDALPDEVDL